MLHEHPLGALSGGEKDLSVESEEVLESAVNTRL